MAGGRHEDLSSLHVPSLDQSYFFTRHINYMRYNNEIRLPLDKFRCLLTTLIINNKYLLDDYNLEFYK